MIPVPGSTCFAFIIFCGIFSTCLGGSNCSFLHVGLSVLRCDWHDSSARFYMFCIYYIFVIYIYIWYTLICRFLKWVMWCYSTTQKMLVHQIAVILQLCIVELLQDSRYPLIPTLFILTSRWYVRYLSLGIWRVLIDKILFSLVFVGLPLEYDQEDGLIQLAVYNSEMDCSIKFACICTFKHWAIQCSVLFTKPCHYACALPLTHFI